MRSGLRIPLYVSLILFYFFYLQLFPWYSAIFFSFKNEIITAENHNFGRGINLTSVH